MRFESVFIDLCVLVRSWDGLLGDAIEKLYLVDDTDFDAAAKEFSTVYGIFHDSGRYDND